MTLEENCDPEGTLRNLHHWLKSMSTGQVKKSQDILAQVEARPQPEGGPDRERGTFGPRGGRRIAGCRFGTC